MKTFNFHDLSLDIYFQDKYARLYLKDGEEVLKFEYKKGENCFTNILIKSPINAVASCSIEEELFDCSTPYGYAGIITNSFDAVFIQEAINAQKDFLFQHKVIACFYRFNPFTNNKIFENYCEFFSTQGQVVYMDLKDPKEERWAKYSSSTRNILRKCIKNLEVIETEDLGDFLKLYKATMDKNNASEFYYFNEAYFQELITLAETKLFLVKSGENVVSAGFFFYSSFFVHYHLSANDYNFSKLNGNYYLLEHAAEVGHANNKEIFLLGGGRTAELNDSLLRFKSKFSTLKNDFFVGGEIIQLDKFNSLNQMWTKEYPENKTPYFLKYRLT